MIESHLRNSIDGWSRPASNRFDYCSFVATVQDKHDNIFKILLTLEFERFNNIKGDMFEIWTKTEAKSPKYLVKVLGSGKYLLIDRWNMDDEGFEVKEICDTHFHLDL